MGQSEGRDSRGQLAMAYGFLGDLSESRKLIEQLDSEAPSDILVQANLVASARALNFLHEKNPEEALNRLESVRKYELGGWFGPEASAYSIMYVRGLAYLQMGDGVRAAAEFQKILDHPGLDAMSCYLPLAQLNLARAYALQRDAAKARVAYENFLALWKDADPNIPVLVAAKSEYAKLQ
jgi:eukaryotic-like serine/threonine-protein kinase